MWLIKKNSWILLFAIIIIASFLRFYQLGSIPAGLTNDEASVGWDAYSILLTGRDQWNQFLPIHFISFGDYPAPVLRYITVIFLFFFNLSAFSVRFPSALCGVISILLIFLLAKKLFNQKIGILASLLFAISPWAIGLSRVTIEPNLSLTIFLSGLYFYFLGREKVKFIYLSFILFAITIYTYSAYVLFLPLIIIFLAIWDRKRILATPKHYVLAFAILILALVPNFVTKNNTASVRFSQIGFTNNINSIGLVNQLNDQRGACLLDYNSGLCKISNNKYVLFSSTFIKNYISHFNISFLNTDGTETQYSILPKRGLAYIFELILLVIGLGSIIRKKEKNGYILISLLLLSPIPDSLTGSGHYGRAFVMLPFLVIIEGAGFSRLLDSFRNKKFITERLAYLVCLLIIFLSTFMFWINYTSYFNNYYSLYSQFGYEELVNKISNEKNNYDKIYLSRHLNDTKQYMYYLFYTKYDPKKFQNKENVSYHIDSDGWISIDKIENIYFIPAVSIKRNYGSGNVLLISHPADFSKKLKVVFVVKDKLGNVIFKAVKLSDYVINPVPLEK